MNQHPRRHLTREVLVGELGIGGNNRIRIQSMTTTPTLDVDATVAQTIALWEAGCELVRITAQNVAAAEALGAIRAKLRAAKCDVPLVADIHFLPAAAMEAVKHVEKVRVNPGNYADKKKFAQREYSDEQYAEELERLHAAVSPLILRCKELGRAIRIGTNHGSLSDRIMNRYGDTPLGMVESALEFIRIAQDHKFFNMVISLKASNPKVMIEAYRLAAFKMSKLKMNYPLHLGVTEAGDGEDGRIKSAIGIGTLLAEGLGDTIRVSLTEDPVYEVPVARELARRAEAFWSEPAIALKNPKPYERRESIEIPLSKTAIGSDQLPRVIVPVNHLDAKKIIKDITSTHLRNGEQRVEGLLLKAKNADDLKRITEIQTLLRDTLEVIAVEVSENITDEQIRDFLEIPTKGARWLMCAGNCEFKWMPIAHAFNVLLALPLTAENVREVSCRLENFPGLQCVATLASCDAREYIDKTRALSKELSLKKNRFQIPFWIRIQKTLLPSKSFSEELIDASLLAGALLCDGIGDAISIETTARFDQTLALSYNLLQGARVRQTKTEFVACPSCGRTLFDLQTTTQKIREATGHLKGVTIAVMGCIVNGPGEMADADFGYVGGAPGKINLYVKKQCVQYNIDENQAVDALIALIKSQGRWIEP
jgi:(E)-4-hydroxy-3-methylbut-2-enyl-diphosphate synthase